MKTLFARISGPLACFLLIAISCGRGNDGQTSSFPQNFNTFSDNQMVEFMMKNASPDSVARFICNSALGKVEAGRIDTLTVAAAYAYEHYADSALIAFSKEFDSFSSTLPLADKMKVYAMAGELDPQRLGYQLGLEYVSHIRDSKMKVEDVRAEIDAFKAACADDSLTYIRFMKGFRTVLRADHGKDLPEAIYKAFAEE